jgi:hypothetical protein
MSEVVEIRHRPQGKVLGEYGRSRAPVHIIRGPLGGGKTYESIDKVLNLCIEQRANKEGVRKTRGVVVRNTYPDLISTVVKDFREVIPESIGHMTMGHPPQLDLDFDLEDGTRVVANIMFLALDKEEDVRKIRGLNATWIYINELKEVARANFDMCSARVDRYPAPGYSTFAGVFGDTNAWDQDHWLEEIAQQIAKGLISDWQIHVQPPAVVKMNGKWEVNRGQKPGVPPAENEAAVNAGYYDRVLKGKREDWILVNLANEIGYSFDGKPVHPEYSDTRNVATEKLIPTPWSTVFVGIDFGLTPAAVFWQRQESGQWWGFDELVMFDTANDAFAIELKAVVARWRSLVPNLPFRFIGDPSGDNRSQTDGRTTFQIYRLAGIPAQAASSNDVQIRRDALDRPLTRTIKGGEPALLLSPHMKWLRKALAGAWCYKRVKVSGKEIYKNEADKNEFSHVGEASEYGLMDAGEHAVINAGGSNNWARQNAPAIIVPANPWSPLSS